MFSSTLHGTKRIIPLLAFLSLTVAACLPPQNSLKILNSMVRDRVITADRIVLKKALFIGYCIGDDIKKAGVVKAQGKLYIKGKKYFISMPDYPKGRFGNLVFDLPYELPQGPYEIEIELISKSGNFIAKARERLDIEGLRPYFNRRGERESRLPFQEISQPREDERFTPSKSDRKRGYIVFSRSPLEYVFPGSRPAQNEILQKFDLKLAQNEFEPFTFTIYPLKDLGNVTVRVTDLLGDEGLISKKNITICHVGEVQSTIGVPEGKFRRLPCLLKPEKRIEVRAGKGERFWLTIRVDESVRPGLYNGEIEIVPEKGANWSIPVTIRVLPFSLCDVPGVDYFMLMTYEFTELCMPWDRDTKKQIYNAGLKVLKDYMDHAMTTMCPHSPFVPVYDHDGTLCLSDIFSTLRAARDMGFHRSIIWYMGHLINTAKSMHPGNIGMFEKEIEIPRLESIVKRVSSFARKNQCPSVVFLPIDEPHDKYNDPSGERLRIAPLLLKTVHELGAKTMVTSFKYFKEADYICSSKFSEEDLNKAHKNGQRYVVYNNRVPTKSEDPGLARYIYGLYVWQTGIDGMCSWTFQTTQNARGLPTVADTMGSDIYLAYPSTNGPIDTIKWEAIREGIDDHKLIYQLENRIAILKDSGTDVASYTHFLKSLRKVTYQQIKDRKSRFFEDMRERLISFILDADEKLIQISKNYVN